MWYGGWSAGGGSGYVYIHEIGKDIILNILLCVHCAVNGKWGILCNHHHELPDEAGNLRVSTIQCDAIAYEWEGCLVRRQ